MWKLASTGNPTISVCCQSRSWAAAPSRPVSAASATPAEISRHWIAAAENTYCVCAVVTDWGEIIGEANGAPAKPIADPELPRSIARTKTRGRSKTISVAPRNSATPWGIGASVLAGSERRRQTTNGAVG